MALEIWKTTWATISILCLLYSFALTGRFFYLRGYEDGKAGNENTFKQQPKAVRGERD